MQAFTVLGTFVSLQMLLLSILQYAAFSLLSAVWLPKFECSFPVNVTSLNK